MAAKRTASQRGFGSAGLKVWAAVCDEFELSEHESALLRETCRCIDTLSDLQKVLDRDGLMVRVDFEGPLRLNPCLAEQRQQRLVLAKLVAALDLPRGLTEGIAPPAPRQHSERHRPRQRLRVVDGTPGMV